MVPKGGLEPPRVSPPPPRTYGPQEDDRRSDLFSPPLPPRRFRCAGDFELNTIQLCVYWRRKTAGCGGGRRDGVFPVGQTDLGHRIKTASQMEMPSWTGSEKRNFLSRIPGGGPRDDDRHDGRQSPGRLDGRCAGSKSEHERHALDRGGTLYPSRDSGVIFKEQRGIRPPSMQPRATADGSSLARFGFAEEALAVHLLGERP